MKKIKGFVKKNYKVVISFILGMIVCIGIGVSAVATKDVVYDNSKSGLTSTNLQGAIDELNTKAKKISHCAEISGDAVTFKVGDYVQMTPSSTSYKTDTSMTGYTSSQTINPSELNLWRIIKVNSDNSVDMVSEYVSSIRIYFSGKTGYQNLVGYLNTIAHQYENSCYTLESRHMGYSNQTPYITDTTVLTSTTAPQSSSTSNNNITSTTEVKGLGDNGYETDYDLVKNACGTLASNKVGTTDRGTYWLASRHYDYDSTYWDFMGLLIYGEGYSTHDNMYIYDTTSSSFVVLGMTASIRPIITLKSKVKASSGDGSSDSPYVLP